MLTRLPLVRRLLLVGLLLVCGDAARADIIVTLDHVAGLDWVYNVRLQPGAFMSVGDPFTVYDFPGLQDADFAADPGVADRTFSLTMAGIGFTPPFVAPTDLPSLENVTVTLSGGNQIVPPPLGGALPLGQLTLTGLSAERGDPINFTGLSAQQAGGSALSNIGFIPAPTAVPEPTTIGFVGAGLLAVAFLALRRRNG